MAREDMTREELFKKLEAECLETYCRVEQYSAVGIRTDLFLDVETDEIRKEESTSNDTWRSLSENEIYVCSFEKDDDDGIDVSELMECISDYLDHDISEEVEQYAEKHHVDQFKACQQLYPEEYDGTYKFLIEKDSGYVLEYVIDPAIEQVINQREEILKNK